jgi:hypothetical protein
MTNDCIVITGKENIAKARMLSMRKALRLEILGLKFRRSVYAQIKREFGLKGSKQRVLEQFSAMIDNPA